jgi:hypothetical protein
METREMELKYGSADLRGYEYQDWVCLGGSVYQTGSTCLKDFHFMAVSQNVDFHL